MTRWNRSPTDRDIRAAFLRAVLGLDHADGALPRWSARTDPDRAMPAPTSDREDPRQSAPAEESPPT